MQELKVPELGENVSQGDVTKVLVKVGDTVAHDQPVIELETDKATVEVPSSVAGVVKEIKVRPGEKVSVGAVILTVDDAGQTATETVAVPPPRQEPDQPDQPEPPDQPNAPDPKVVAMPRPAPPPTGTRPPQVEVSRPKTLAAPASPSVRRLAREIGVDVDAVAGSGPDGRISQEDVKEHARRSLSSAGTTMASTRGAGIASPRLPDFERWGPIDRQPMNNIRRKTAEHLSHAWTTVAHVTQFDRADITSMEELRSRFRAQVEQAGGNLTVTAVLVKVLAAAVKQYPQFNASLDTESNSIIFKKYVNVGVAVDTEHGLLVPVIRQADQKNITQIAIELHQLSEKARARKLTLEEMSGGGISISNLGGIGGTYFTPIVNWPEVAILGVSRGSVQPVWRQDTFEPRQLLPLSLSYDHRVIDGADAMRFLRWVVDAVEQPFLLSLLG
jgi:pyruvate dehydrogenase E2 component (dihydrolipoamide acetyltransferase)